MSYPGSQRLAPTIYNLVLTDADTEYSQQLAVGLNGFSMQCRTNFDVRFAFEAGKVATPTAPYATLKAGQAYTSPDGISACKVTVYFASAQAGVIMEIVPND